MAHITEGAPTVVEKQGKRKPLTNFQRFLISSGLVATAIGSVALYMTSRGGQAQSPATAAALEFANSTIPAKVLFDPTITPTDTAEPTFTPTLAPTNTATPTAEATNTPHVITATPKPPTPTKAPTETRTPLPPSKEQQALDDLKSFLTHVDTITSDSERVNVHLNGIYATYKCGDFKYVEVGPGNVDFFARVNILDPDDNSAVSYLGNVGAQCLLFTKTTELEGLTQLNQLPLFDQNEFKIGQSN